jgi:hypothetical protein
MQGKVVKSYLSFSVFLSISLTDGSTEVGKISKQWSGLLREAFTDADNFGISFPMDLVIFIYQHLKCRLEFVVTNDNLIG